MEGSILALLEQHGSLGYEQIAAHLGEPPDAVRNALTGLRERGLIDVLSVGELQGQLTTAASYWRLTLAGLSLRDCAAYDSPNSRLAHSGQ